MIRDVQRKWIKYRDKECLYVDSTDGITSDTECVIESIGLSIHYLTRLKQIQFDKKGLQEIDQDDSATSGPHIPDHSQYG